MHTFDIVQTVAFAASFLALASRLLVASRSFWSRFPAWAQTLLPVLLPALTAAAQGLTGVKSWSDLSVLFLVCAGMLLPGLPSNRSAAPLQAGKMPTLTPSVGDVAVSAQVVKLASIAPPPGPVAPWSGPSSVAAVLLLCCLGFQQPGCALFKGPVTPRTIDDAAVTLCTLFFKQQKPGMSLDDIERLFCTAARDIEPFLAQAKRAQRIGGELATHRADAVPDAGGQ